MMFDFVLHVMFILALLFYPLKNFRSRNKLICFRGAHDLILFLDKIYCYPIFTVTVLIVILFVFVFLST